MSAFLVSHQHIAAIVNGMARNSIIPHEDRVKIGKILIRTNLKGLKQRYGKKHSFCDSDSKYITDFERYYLSNYNIDWTVIVKLCDCYDYQAFEYSGYEKTRACKLIHKLRVESSVRAVQDSTLYSSAPWEI